MFSCVSRIVKNTHLPVYVLQAPVSCRSLNTDPMSCVWIGHFSRPWQLGGRRIAACPGGQLLLPLVLPSNSGALCHIHLSWMSAPMSLLRPHIASSVQFKKKFFHPPACPLARSLSPGGPACLSVAHFHLSLCLCFPSSPLSAGTLACLWTSPLQSDNFSV